jgi:lysophospholipase L1-like esterase
MTRHERAAKVESYASRWSRIVLLAGALALPALGQGPGADGPSRWVGSWSASTQGPFLGPAASFGDVTLRQVVHLSLGGSTVRVRFSNAQGGDPFTVGAASVGLQATGATVKSGTLRPLTFGGAGSITIPPHGLVLSDPVRLDAAAGADLAVSLFVPQPSEGLTQLSLAHQTSYVSTAGDFTQASSMPVGATITSWYWLSGVEVKAGPSARALVTFGDSITEGFASTTDANARWPDALARRLQASGRTREVAVLNEAISGNRVLNEEIGPNALSRVDRDVLTQGGLAYVTVLLGTNDLGFSQLSIPGLVTTDVSAADLIAGYRQIILRAHQAGAKVYGCTILPFEGASYWTPAAEVKRQAINTFIRTAHAYDAVIDFDAAMRDPAQPSKLRAEFDSGDHLHPNDAGYAVMGNVPSLSLFAE